MSTEPVTTESKFALTIKDVISMVTMAVTLTLAWGVFGTRLTVMEKEIINVNSTLKEQKDQLRANDIRMSNDETRMRDIESSIEDLWRNTKRSKR